MAATLEGGLPSQSWWNTDDMEASLQLLLLARLWPLRAIWGLFNSARYSSWPVAGRWDEKANLAEYRYGLQEAKSRA